MYSVRAGVVLIWFLLIDVSVVAPEVVLHRLGPGPELLQLICSL